MAETASVPATDPAIKEATSNTDRFYTQVKSLHNFDNIEVRCVINNLLSKTPVEECHFANYIRTRATWKLCFYSNTPNTSRRSQ